MCGFHNLSVSQAVHIVKVSFRMFGPHLANQLNSKEVMSLTQLGTEPLIDGPHE